MAKTEVRIAGFGGQGVVLAGVLLGRAAVLYEQKQVVQTQSYGAESRGGAARSEVIISDEPIIYPKVLNPDILVTMSQAALDKYVKDLRGGGTLIIDQDLVQTLPDRNDFRVYRSPFSEIANKEIGKTLVANMVMLGFMVSVTGIVSLDALRESVRTGVPKGTEELNMKAVEVGIRMGELRVES